MTERQHETIQVEPLNPVIGAEISGVDLRQPLGNQTYQEIHAALSYHLVVFFRNQDIDWDQQKAFGARLWRTAYSSHSPETLGTPRDPRDKSGW